MTVAPGTRLGAYEITGKLGEGGMGEVYRATDSRLKREVAIKVLPAAFTADRERLQRFEREAQLLAQLHHPHIASIFGLEESDGVRALVMELVEGPTLAERLAQGPLAVEDCVAIARQIAEALEEAHEKGIVHRDLKPANVKLTGDGRVKVLDFGLAKAMDAASAASAADLARSPTLMHSPTITGAPGTQLGVILGTAAYMSPEQAKGAAVDKRADIWAFGVVLYEMLSGDRLFAGDSVAEVVAGVLKGEIDLDRLPAETPARVCHLLERCLVRDRRQRLHDIGDARLELEDAARPHGIDETVAVASPSRARVATLVALGTVAGVLLGAFLWRSLAARASDAEVAAPHARVSIVPPAGQQILGADISPDGGTLLLVLRVRGDRLARPRLYLRPLDRFEAQAVPESDGTSTASFSPDSHWLYFVGPVAAGATELRMARVPVDGSAAPVTVRRWDRGWGNWTLLADGSVLTTLDTGRKWLLLPANGADAPAARSFVGDVAGAILAFTDQRLPDGRPVLGVAHYGSRGYQNGVAVFDQASGKASLLVDDAFHGVPLPSGQLLFGRGEALLVAPLDATGSKVTDAPRSVIAGLRTVSLDAPYPSFRLARNGTLLYTAGGRVGSGRQLVVVDAQGVITPWSPERMPFLTDLSTGAGRLTVTAMEPAGLLYEIWIAERDATTPRRLVTVPGVDNQQPVLSRDGSQLAFLRYASSPQDGIYVRAVDGAGEERRLATTTPEITYSPCDWSPDGSRLVATRTTAGKSDLISFALGGAAAAAPQALLATAFDESGAVFAPDGRSLAFVSNESGRNEIDVAPVREDGSLGPYVAVSAGPGVTPEWRPDGRSLLFWDGQDHILSVEVSTAPRVTAGTPQVLLDLPKLGLTPAFAVLPDGRLVMVARGDEEGEIPRLDLVLGFTDELAKAEASKP